MKKRLFSLLAVICLIIPGILMFTGCKSGSEKTMQVSVNPEVSFVVDAKNNIVSVSYENEDAGRIYANINFVGKDVDSALQLFIEQSAISGHVELNGDEVELSVNGSVEKDIEELKQKAKQKIESVFNDLGVTVQVSVENLSETARKAALVTQASVLAPEKSYAELNAMNNEDLVELIKNKQKEYEGLAYNQISTIKTAFSSAQNTILQLISSLRSSVESLEDTITSLEESLGSLVEDNAQFQQYKAQLETKKTEIEQKINEFLQAKQAEINNAKAQYETKKQELVNAFKLEVSSAKSNFMSHLDLALENEEITQEQYNYWKNLVEANEAE